MPTYEFRCVAGHATDRFFPKMSEAPTDIECPECGETAARQLSGGAGLHFKGSGFYITDYARKPQQKEDGAQETTVKSEGDDKSPAKTETKPAESKPAGSKTPSGSDKSPDK